MSEKSRKRKDSSALILSLGHFDTLEDRWFIVMQVLTQLIGGGIGKKLLDIRMEILILMAMKALLALSIEEADASFVRVKFIVKSGGLSGSLVDVFGVALPEGNLFMPEKPDQAY